MKGLPKISAFVGTYDILSLDAEKMADKVRRDGFDYAVYVYPKMIHGYTGFHFMPEAKYAMKQVKNIIDGKAVENIQK